MIVEKGIFGSSFLKKLLQVAFLLAGSYWLIGNVQGQTPQAPTFTNSPLAVTSAVNVSFAPFTFQASGYPNPAFTLSLGSFPPGLSLSSAGVLSGTPDQTGIYTGIVSASNSVSPNATQDFSIQVQAPTQYVLLHQFADPTVANDGPYPTTVIYGKDGNLHGTTSSTIFKMTLQGNETILHVFNDGSVANDGQVCLAGLIEDSSNNFYGTTSKGGTSNEGTIFELTSQGVYSVLHSFNSSNEGASPYTGLIKGSDGNFYGTTSRGPGFDGGTIFKMTPQGVVTTVYTFGSSSHDGEYPGNLMQASDGNFYGMTSEGGTSNYGIVFKVTTGGAETILYNFTTLAYDYTYATFIPTPGALIQGADKYLYGSTYGSEAGYNDTGTVFKISTTGAEGITTLVSSQASLAPLIIGSDGNFYGTTYKNASVSNDPTIFKMTPQGTVTNLAVFTTSSDGASPGPLIQTSDGNFYGTCGSGGFYSQGTVFKLSPAMNSGDFRPIYNSSTYIPLTLGNFTATGYTFNMSLGFIPTQGTVLTAIDNTGSAPISGTFTNLADGGTFTSNYIGANYNFTANYEGGDGNDLTLTLISISPTITSTNGAIFTIGQASSFTVTATGTPTPTLSATGLPSWASFNTTNGVLSGISPNTTGSPFTINITASNGVTPNATQVFTLNVQPLKTPPSITSASATTFALGQPGSFIVTATGYPAPTFSATGLPSWASLNSTNGVLSGTPPNTTGAPFTINLTAANGNSPNATQSLTLNVQPVQTFSQWETSNDFTGTSTVIGPTDTPENDGVPNLLKYLYNINPSVPMSAIDRAALPITGTTTVEGNDYLTLTYRQYVLETGITINVQASPDLQTWTTLTPTSTPLSDTVQQVGNDPVTGDPIMQVQVPASGTREFIRLNVTQP